MNNKVKDITKFVRAMQGTGRYKKIDAFTYPYLKKQIEAYNSIKHKRKEILK